jgi:hypothetical protein
LIRCLRTFWRALIVSCNGGWIIGAMFAIDGWRKWMEMVDYLWGNRDEERWRHKTTIRPLACMCVDACVCVCVCVREKEWKSANERKERAVPERVFKNRVDCCSVVEGGWGLRVTYTSQIAVKAQPGRACYDRWEKWSSPWTPRFGIWDSAWKVAVFKRGVRFSGVDVLTLLSDRGLGGLASGRGSVKQRPNPPDSAAKTDVLGHMLV